MKGIADTGFIVAFANKDDQHHAWAADLALQVTEPLVLKTRGNGLEVLKTKNKGFRNIQTGTLGQAGRFITTVRFGFDGKAYRKYSKRTQESR